jgi:mycofactocin precursor
MDRQGALIAVDSAQPEMAPFTRIRRWAANSNHLQKKGEEMEDERREKEQLVEDSLDSQEPAILDEIDIEELAVDGICGIY